MRDFLRVTRICDDLEQVQRKREVDYLKLLEGVDGVGNSSWYALTHVRGVNPISTSYLEALHLSDSFLNTRFIVR